MDPRWEAHNLHQLYGVESFRREDPTLRRLQRVPLVFESDLLRTLEGLPAGIFTIGGGRQVGKTTLLKQLMLRLLEEPGFDPLRLTYLTGEPFVDGDDFRRVLTDIVAEFPDGPHFLLIDEVTYVRDWDRAIKFLADAGMLERTRLLLTGSDLILIQNAMSRLPGRRGRAPQVDFHYFPLSFRAFCILRGQLDEDSIRELAEGPPHAPLPVVADDVLGLLEAEFVEYHRTGGYLSAINDLAENQSIATATLRIYSDWLRGDVLKQGRSEAYLREVLGAIVTRYTTQVTWNALARELSIDHPKTVAEYCTLLERMDAVHILPALLEDRLTAAPKKARKLYFSDPFIYHAARSFLAESRSRESETGARHPIRSEEELAMLVEGSIVGHLRRTAETFYIKAEGEVDAAYIRDGRFWPIEVKWTSQVRPKDLKQIAKYPNGLIAARVRGEHRVSGVQVLPAPVVLLRIG